MELTLKCKDCDWITRQEIPLSSMRKQEFRNLLQYCDMCCEPECEIVSIKVIDSLGEITFEEEYLEEYLDHGPGYIRERLCMDEENKFTLNSLNSLISDSKEKIFKIPFEIKIICALLIYFFLLAKFLIFYTETNEKNSINKARIEQTKKKNDDWSDDKWKETDDDW